MGTLQFSYIAKRRSALVAAGEPVISVDTKKKELNGNFENAGQSWGAQAEQVNVEMTFPSEAPRGERSPLWDLLMWPKEPRMGDGRPISQDARVVRRGGHRLVVGGGGE
ncbi:MAG: hypothetical protein LC674_07110, partial [Actinobacteria bacterium]|nr:hypothetical protein [Actinomycetota bacterium]